MYIFTVPPQGSFPVCFCMRYQRHENYVWNKEQMYAISSTFMFRADSCVTKSTQWTFRLSANMHQEFCAENSVPTCMETQFVWKESGLEVSLCAIFVTQCVSFPSEANSQRSIVEKWGLSLFFLHATMAQSESVPVCLRVEFPAQNSRHVWSQGSWWPWIHHVDADSF